MSKDVWYYKRSSVDRYGDYDFKIFYKLKLIARTTLEKDAKLICDTCNSNLNN